MAGHTKMIIITSDESLIRQFSLNKKIDTQIIDLDNNSGQILSQKNNDDIINLPFLAELSKLNSTNDQVYKRALDSIDHAPTKPVKTLRKSIDLICAICGDKGIGYNYDVPSCGSCKAFFRRNANKNLGSLKCLSRQGQCSVAHDTHRKCPRCRLERCFAVGMRKDFMLSEEEKQRKKFNLEQNRSRTSQSSSNSEDISLTSDELDHLLTNLNEDDEENINLNFLDDTLLDVLSVEDWLTIENLRTLFITTFQKDLTKCHSFDCKDQQSALISWSYLANENALSFIRFFRQINEFEELDSNDRLILIKYNLFPLYTILKCFYYNKKRQGFCSGGTDEEMIKRQRFFSFCFGSADVRERFHNVIKLLVEITDQDTAILSLFLVILMFYQGLSMNEDEPPLKDISKVNRAQSYYVKLLSHYMINKWDEIEACKHLSQLFLIIFRMQITTKALRDYFCAQLTSSNATDKIAPLMQSVLHIS